MFMEGSSFFGEDAGAASPISIFSSNVSTAAFSSVALHIPLNRLETQFTTGSVFSTTSSFTGSIMSLTVCPAFATVLINSSFFFLNRLNVERYKMFQWSTTNDSISSTCSHTLSLYSVTCPMNFSIKGWPCTICL